MFSALTHGNVIAFSCIKLSVTVFVGFLFYRTGSVEQMSGSNLNLGNQFGGYVLDAGYFVTFTILSIVVASNIFTLTGII